MNSRLLATTISITAFAFFALLGLAVTHGTEAPTLSVLQRSMVNHGTLLAWWFTWLGYAYVLAPICVAMLVLAWRVPSWRVRAIFSIVMLLVCWQAADLCQHLFARARPLDWVVKHETSFSYPSSHATIAFGFYILWSVLVQRSTLPRRQLWAALLLLVGLGICWSRLALGAHFVTDVLGGALLATALVAAGVAVLPINVLGRRVGRA